MFTIPKNYKFLLFDMDGTLVDTEPVGPRIVEELFAEIGVSLTNAENDLFLKAWRRDGTTITTPELLTELIAKYRIHMAADYFVRVFYDRYKAAIVSADELPGASNFMAAAKAGGKSMALVTSSRRDEAEAIIGHHKWDGYFDVLIGEEDITKFKPDPEPYQIAMQRLGATSEQCLVLEDAKNGALAGHAAGTFVIGLRAGDELPQDLHAADQIVDSFNDLTLEG
jgi:beta-phosphoglucomutase